jgi:hypothetical protein
MAVGVLRSPKNNPKGKARRQRMEISDLRFETNSSHELNVAALSKWLAFQGPWQRQNIYEISSFEIANPNS